MMNFSKSPARYGNIKEITERVFVLQSIDENFEISPTDESGAEVTIITRFLHDGRVAKRDQFSFEKLEHTDLYYYNEFKKLIKTIRTDSTGKEIGKTITRYNEKGLMIEYITYCDPETIDFTFNYQYNSESYLISETHSCQDNKKDITFFEYLPDSRVRILKNKDIEGRVTGKTMEFYNEARYLVLSRDYDEKGYMTREVKDKYDVHGNIVKTIIIHHTQNGIEEIIHNYEYWFDSQNNWVKNHHYMNNEFISMVVRELVYL